MIRDKNKMVVANLLFNLSVVCVVLALVGSFGADLWLASTQWILVSLVLVSWAIYILLEAGFRIK